MPIADAIQDIAAPRFLQPFQEDRLWRGLCFDASDMYPGYGNTIQFPTMEGAESDDATFVPTDNASKVTPGASIADLAWGNPKIVDLETEALTINKERDVNFLVDYLTQRRVRPSTIAEAAKWMGLRMLEAVNDDIRNVFMTNTDISDVETIDVTAANFATPNAAFENSLKDAFGKAKLAADVARIPADGRQAIVSPRIHFYLSKKLRDDNLFLASENRDFAVNAEVVRWGGWDIVADNSAGDGVANTDDEKHTIAFARRGTGIYFAGELNRMRMFESEVSKGTIMRALYTWGVKVIEPKKLLRTKINIT